MIESTKLKIKRGFEKAGEKASSTAGNVTSGVKTVIRGAQHILIILNPPATKNNSRIDTKHQIEFGEVPSKSGEVPSEPGEAFSKFGELFSNLPKELKVKILSDAYAYDSKLRKEIIPKKNQQDFIEQFHRFAWNNLYNLKAGGLTYRSIQSTLQPVIEKIKVFAEAHLLPPKLRGAVNSLTQACESKDGKTVERAFLDLCIEIYRVKNGIDESDLGKRLEQFRHEVGPGILLLTRYNENRNSSLI